MNSSVNKSSSPTFLPTTSTHRHTQRQQQLYIKKWSLYNVELASRRVPGPLCQTKQKPAPPGHRELPPEVTEVLRRPSLPPRPSQAISTFTEDLVPSAQSRCVPPAALLSCQHFLRSSADIPACRACVRNAALQAGPPGPLRHRTAAPALAAGPTSKLSFSPFQKAGAKQDLQMMGVRS